MARRNPNQENCFYGFRLVTLCLEWKDSVGDYHKMGGTHFFDLTADQFLMIYYIMCGHTTAIDCRDFRKEQENKTGKHPL